MFISDILCLTSREHWTPHSVPQLWLCLSGLFVLTHKNSENYLIKGVTQIFPHDFLHSRRISLGFFFLLFWQREGIGNSSLLLRVSQNYPIRRFSLSLILFLDLIAFLKGSHKSHIANEVSECSLSLVLSCSQHY